MFDELNYFEYDIEDIEQKLKAYFKEMPEITDEQLEERVKVGKKVFNLIMLFLLMVQSSAIAQEIQDIEYYTEMLQRRYLDLVAEEYVVDNYLINYINNFAIQSVNTTIENIDSDYYLSDDRALNMAENEANTIVNYNDYRKAVEKGYTRKKWLSMKDAKVRKTHHLVDDKEIDIKALFHVGNSLMLFPHDTSNGADAKEIIHCRCHIKYF